jgi:hypothetical protein
MPAERCRVGIKLKDLNQYYQRDREEKRKGRYVAVPFFVVDTNQAVTMSESAAKMFVARLRSLGVSSAWIEDCVDGRRIEFTSESSQSGKVARTPVAASIDDVNDYVIKPANTPNGTKWFLRIDLPGVAEPQIVHADDPLGVLQRAEDMGVLLPEADFNNHAL